MEFNRNEWKEGLTVLKENKSLSQWDNKKKKKQTGKIKTEEYDNGQWIFRMINIMNSTGHF